jgi:hypothetical protein
MEQTRLTSKGVLGPVLKVGGKDRLEESNKGHKIRHSGKFQKGWRKGVGHEGKWISALSVSLKGTTRPSYPSLRKVYLSLQKFPRDLPKVSLNRS